MGRVNKITQCYLPPTSASANGMSHARLYSPAAVHQRTLVDTHIPSH